MDRLTSSLITPLILEFVTNLFPNVSRKLYTELKTKPQNIPVIKTIKVHTKTLKRLLIELKEGRGERVIEYILVENWERRFLRMNDQFKKI